MRKVLSYKEFPPSVISSRVQYTSWGDARIRLHTQHRIAFSCVNSVASMMRIETYFVCTAKEEEKQPTEVATISWLTYMRDKP